MLKLFYQATNRVQASEDARKLAAGAFEYLTRKAAPEIQKMPSGKPFFRGNEYYLSITHTQTVAMCALSDGPVGVDAEQVREVSPHLVQRCLAPAELERWREDAQPHRLFLRYWTLKEAYAKYTGVGIWGFPSDLCFHLEGDTARLEGASLWFYSFEIGDLMVSVCSEKPQKLQICSDFLDWTREQK